MHCGARPLLVPPPALLPIEDIQHETSGRAPATSVRAPRRVWQPAVSAREQRRMRRWATAAWFASGACVGALGLGAILARRPAPAPDPRAALVRGVFEAILTHADQPISPQQLDELASRRMVEALSDPWAEFLAPEQRRRYRAELRQPAGVPGVRLRETPLGTLVEAVAPQSPAERAGVRPGDRARRLPASSPGALLLDLRAPGETAWRRVQFPPGGAPDRVEALPLAEHAVLLRVPRFYEGVARDVERALAAAVRGGASHVVFDLRGNPGGLFEEGIALAEQLLDSGRVVTTVDARGGARRQRIADRAPQRWPDLRASVLIDGSTASSAELVAAAWQDHGRARLVGAPTFGKGVFQTTVALQDGYAVRISSGRWYSPAGFSPDRASSGGVRPDARVAADEVTPLAEGEERLLMGIEAAVLGRPPLQLEATLASPAFAAASTDEVERLRQRGAGDAHAWQTSFLRSDPFVREALVAEPGAAP
jgi:carboxyl-terminal processing protease